MAPPQHFCCTHATPVVSAQRHCGAHATGPGGHSGRCGGDATGAAPVQRWCCARATLVSPPVDMWCRRNTGVDAPASVRFSLRPHHSSVAPVSQTQEPCQQSEHRNDGTEPASSTGTGSSSRTVGPAWRGVAGRVALQVTCLRGPTPKAHRARDGRDTMAARASLPKRQASQ